MNAERIRENLRGVQARIAEAARRSGRPAEAVRLVAVTKQSPLEWIRPLVACGARDLGENYPQELWRKAEALADLGGFRPLAPDWTLAIQQGQENSAAGRA